MVAVLFLGVIASVLLLVGPGLISGLRSGAAPLLGTSDCTVETADGVVGLSREEARLATTAVALQARGAPSPETASIDDAALQALSAGPADDAGPVLRCEGAAADELPQEELTATGLTPRAEQLRTAMADAFGDQSLGGFEPGGVDQGHGGESTHYDGRAVDVFFRPVTEDNRRSGWMLAHWLVAHADELDVQYVIFDDRFWSSRNSRGTWQPYEAPQPANEILRHLDHVHVDVLRGG